MSEPPRTRRNSSLYFLTHGGLIDQDALFATEMRRRCAVESVAMVHGRREVLRAASTGAFAEVVDLVAGSLADKRTPTLERNLEELQDLEQRYPGPPLLQAVMQDRWLYPRFPYGFIVAYLAHGVKVVSDCLERRPPLALLGELTMAIYQLARRLTQGRAPYFFPVGARFFPRFYFEDEPYFLWNECQGYYRRFLTDGVPRELESAVEPVMTQIEGRRRDIAMFEVVKAHPAPAAEPLGAKFSFERLRRNFNYWQHDFTERDRNPRVAPWKEELPFYKAARWLVEWRRVAWVKRHCLEAINSQRAFCSYFLHFQPEYTVDSLGYEYANQVELVRVIAQSLPASMPLLVKEQPFMLGQRPIRYYQDLQRIPNVRLVGPRANSRELIARSRIVFTITGTAALEALVLGVPAILFGRVFLSGFEGIRAIRELHRLPEVVHEQLHQPRRVTRESVRAALAAMYQASYPGRLYSEVIDPRSVLNPENASLLGAALENELRKRSIIR